MCDTISKKNYVWKSLLHNPEFADLNVHEKFVFLNQTCWKEVGQFLSDAWSKRKLLISK